ncbi:hypothetical protein C8R47DRAFT_1136529 [Mycena vitilis]|nr:hypothetical protein C8R47DRAFT_1136529 [Mycena vitilis]
MDWVLESIEQLPDEVLAAILKLAADSPVHTRDLRTLPLSIAASRVSRRWRAVSINSPELWTTIRLSHRSWSWIWARVFVKRSRSYPLDISINLESYDNHSYRDEKPISLDKVLDILGPHVGRWRTLALRCWGHELEQFCDFSEQSQPACRLQSANISLVNGYFWGEARFPLALAPLLNGKSFYSLRANFPLEIADFAVFRAIRSLDIDLDRDRGPLQIDGFRLIMGPSSPLETLILRGFVPKALPVGIPIDCPTIRSLAISFAMPFYCRRWPHLRLGGFDSFTNRFSLPNLEYLEILGGFTGSIAEQCSIAVPEVWQAPLFPHLRTLRLEEVGFSPNGLAFIQSFSCGITALQLVYTTGNRCLLEQHEDTAWPALRSLTVETPNGVSDPNCLELFVAMRASLGEPRRISELKVFPAPGGITLPVDSPPEIRWLCDGPSPALMDGTAGNGFYIDEYDARIKDFEHVEPPEDLDSWSWYFDWNHESNWEADERRLQEEIAETFKMAGELVRASGIRRKLRRERRGDHKMVRRGAGRSSRITRLKRRCADVREDFFFR